VAILALRKPEVPQSALARLGFKTLADLLLALGVGPTVTTFADLGFVLGLHRHDVLAHHGAHLLHQGLHLGRHAEIHRFLHPAIQLTFARLKHALSRERRHDAGTTRPSKPRRSPKVGPNAGAVQNPSGGA